MPTPFRLWLPKKKNQIYELHHSTVNYSLTDYGPYGAHSGWGGSPYSPHQNIPSQGHFSERYKSFFLLLQAFKITQLTLFFWS